MARRNPGATSTAGSRAAFVLTWATVALVGAVFCDARAAHSGYLPRASPFDVMLGQAATPFQYRLLVPKLTYLLVTLFPSLVSQARFCLEVAEWLFFVGTFACVYRLLRVVATGPERAPFRAVVALLAVPFAYLVLPPFRPFYNACDTPAMFFAVASVLALVCGRSWTFVGLFFVATLNRETTVTVLAVWALATLRGGTLRRDAVALSVSGAGFLALKMGLALLYQDNPGDGLFQTRHDIGAHALHAVTNLDALMSFPRGAWFAALVLGPLALALSLRRTVAHPLLRACIDVVPPVVLLLLVVGNLDELRMFADVMALVFVALAASSASGNGAGLRGGPGLLDAGAPGIAE